MIPFSELSPKEQRITIFGYVSLLQEAERKLIQAEQYRDEILRNLNNAIHIGFPGTRSDQ